MKMTRRSESGLELSIRVATDADRARLIRLVNAAFAVESFMEGTRTDEARLAAMMRKGEVLLAEDGGGRTLGCVYTEVRATEVRTTEARSKRGYIGMLAVDPAFQRAGLGRRMVEAAEQHLRRQGCVGADITVLSLRGELPPIYRRFGYVETGTEVFHPSQPLKAGVECHGIVMSKEL
jgi:predicted N-acetyltransferase YhbS